MDERATLANMATECVAKTGIVEGDEQTVEWIAARRKDLTKEQLRARLVRPDPGAVYAGGVHRIDLASIAPMVATPGDPDRGIPSDPGNGANVEDLPPVRIDIAYGGSCTAGKQDDVDASATVVAEALAAGRRVAPGVRFYIQFGSEEVETYARTRGYLDDFRAAGVEVIRPGCGACIGCGPGVSETGEQVTVSAINRNFKGRSAPGSSTSLAVDRRPSAFEAASRPSAPDVPHSVGPVGGRRVGTLTRARPRQGRGGGGGRPRRGGAVEDASGSPPAATAPPPPPRIPTRS
jgi:3-isopropylmalate/(R)-2-methylmalate dehydratase large subunit